MMVEQAVPIFIGATTTPVIVTDSPESNSSTAAPSSTPTSEKTHFFPRGNINLDLAVSIIPIYGHGKVFGR